MCVLLSGCGAGTYIPVMAQALEQVAKMVKDSTGQSISDLPMECIIDPIDTEVNILCTIYLEK